MKKKCEKLGVCDNSYLLNSVLINCLRESLSPLKFLPTKHSTNKEGSDTSEDKSVCHYPVE